MEDVWRRDSNDSNAANQVLRGGLRSSVDTLKSSMNISPQDPLNLDNMDLESPWDGKSHTSEHLDVLIANSTCCRCSSARECAQART